MRKMVFAAASVVICGCGTPGLPTSLDGNWLITSDKSATCIVIANGKVISVDEGCNGVTESILESSNSAGISDGKVLISYREVSGNSTEGVLIDLSPQSDGSLQGTALILPPPPAQASSFSVIMSKQP